MNTYEEQQSAYIRLGLKQYEIFNDGRIWDIARNKWQKTRIGSRGYKVFNYPSNHTSSKNHPIEVHKVVAMAFLDYQPNKHERHTDHIDGNKLNNRLSNLRIVTPRLNHSNKQKHRSGSRCIGCTYAKMENVWMAFIKINNITIRLGTFNTELQAHEKYCNARLMYQLYGTVPTPAVKTIIRKRRCTTIKGCSLNKKQNIWVSKFRGKYLGSFNSYEQAHARYLEQLKNS